MASLWRDWVMMNKLHCTWSQLRAEPLEETLVFGAFMRGEEAGLKARREG